MTASGILAAEMATATTLAHHTTATRILRHHHQNQQQQQHQSQASRVDDDSNGKPMEQDDIKGTCSYLILKMLSLYFIIIFKQ